MLGGPRPGTPSPTNLLRERLPRDRRLEQRLPTNLGCNSPGIRGCNSPGISGRNSPGIRGCNSLAISGKGAAVAAVLRQWLPFRCIVWRPGGGGTPHRLRAEPSGGPGAPAAAKAQCASAGLVHPDEEWSFARVAHRRIPCCLPSCAAARAGSELHDEQQEDGDMQETAERPAGPDDPAHGSSNRQGRKGLNGACSSCGGPRPSSGGPSPGSPR